MRVAVLFTFLTLSASPVFVAAQWEIQDAHITADLRGIESLGNGIAWASGSGGTVVRTEDSGATWKTCAVPAGAEALDFRGIQAFGSDTAIVLSSGKGDLSRLYKTTDGCQSWKLLATNKDKDGFWDAIQFQDSNYGVLLGDPVGGKFYARYTSNGGYNWEPFVDDGSLHTTSGNAGVFAASNSALLLPQNHAYIFAAANDASGVLLQASLRITPCSRLNLSKITSTLKRSADRCPREYAWDAPGKVPIAHSDETSGVVAIAMDPSDIGGRSTIVAVGGDYAKPNEAGAAAYTHDRTENWTLAATPPHGYRSAVAFDDATGSWVTVGPNGTDTSTDGGTSWRPLAPGPTDAPEADQHWNALSLPFAVGPKGRIGMLRSTALENATAAADFVVPALAPIHTETIVPGTPDVPQAAPIVHDRTIVTTPNGAKAPTTPTAPVVPPATVVTPAPVPDPTAPTAVPPTQ